MDRLGWRSDSAFIARTAQRRATIGNERADLEPAHRRRPTPGLTATRPRSRRRSSCAGRTAGTSERTFEAPNPAGLLADPGRVAAAAEAVRARHVPVPVGRRVCTSATRWATSAPTSTAAQADDGRNVLYSMGFDAFGLPAEQYAVQTGQHPAITTEPEHRHDCGASCAGWGSATTGAASSTTDRLLPLDAVDLPADLRRLVRTDAPTARGPPIAELTPSSRRREPPTGGRGPS